MTTADDWMRSQRRRDRIQHDTTYTPPATPPGPRTPAVEWTDPVTDDHPADETHLRTCSSCANLNGAGR